MAGVEGEEKRLGGAPTAEGEGREEEEVERSEKKGGSTKKTAVRSRASSHCEDHTFSVFPLEGCTNGLVSLS